MKITINRMKAPVGPVAAIVLTGLFSYSCSITDHDSMSSGLYGQNEYLGKQLIDRQPGGDRFDKFTDNPFIKTADEKVSTFSVDADGASYAYMRRNLMEGRHPVKESVRIEEFLNYFTFDYEEPQDGKAVAINSEVGPCPWNETHHLLRLGIKGKSLPESEVPVANFVFLIDVSGSMDSNDKLPLLQKSLTTMVDYLNPKDRIAIVTYAGGVQKLLASTPASEASKIKAAINSLSAYGSTAGGAGMKMAYEEALENFIKDGNNRVIMGTDGDFNVGVTSTDELLEMVQNYAGKGIYLTVCGFGLGNLNDAMMEKISNKGNGTYHYIDSEGEMTKVFVNERARFVAVANDGKAQVTFDPAMVESYRLIGYENRVLREEDFENDKKDAGEIGAGQTVTALYEIVPGKDWGTRKPLAKFGFRYKEQLGGESVPLESAVTTDDGSRLTPNLAFAAGIASYGMLLRHSEHAGNSTWDLACECVRKSLSPVDAAHELPPYQVKLREELIALIEKAKSIKSE